MKQPALMAKKRCLIFHPGICWPRSEVGTSWVGDPIESRFDVCRFHDSSAPARRGSRPTARQILIWMLGWRALGPWCHHRQSTTSLFWSTRSLCPRSVKSAGTTRKNRTRCQMADGGSHSRLLGLMKSNGGSWVGVRRWWWSRPRSWPQKLRCWRDEPLLVTTVEWFSFS